MRSISAGQLLRAVTPAGALQAQAALTYRRSHGLSVPLSRLIPAYLNACRFGLQMLPTGARLDGLVLDLGANAGDFSAAVRALEPRARVWAFEPGYDASLQLRQRFSADPLVTVDSRALSNASGSAIFNVSHNSVFSSLLSLRDQMEEFYEPAQLSVTQHVEVDTTRLDDVIAEPVKLLKIDVQGHELAVFDGGRQTLQHTAVILVEVLFVSHYEGDALFADIDRYLREMGFTLRALNAPYTSDGEVLWADACYAQI